MHPGLLVGAGVLLGTAGAKILKSKPAHKVCVGATRLGLKVRDGVESTIDDAKAELDDIFAEAEYLNQTEMCDCCADACDCADAAEGGEGEAGAAVAE